MNFKISCFRYIRLKLYFGGSYMILPKLIVADIDGTLVNDDGEMMDLTRSALKILHKCGILLGLATGRGYDSTIKDKLKKWDFEEPGFDMMIGLNGGQIYNKATDTLDQFNELQPEAIKEIILMMEPLDLNPFLYRDGRQLAKRMDDATRASSLRNNQKVIVAEDLSQMWSRSCPKLMFRVPEERMPEVEAWAYAHQTPSWKAFKTQTTMLEFCDPLINKGFALKEYGKRYGILTEEIMAFGDMTNDNELLETAGWGVCLKNGAEDTKACADAVTEYTNNEDGLGNYLYDHVLPLLNVKNC